MRSPVPLYILATPLFCIMRSALHSCAQPQPPHFLHLYSLYLLLLKKKFPPLAFHLSLSLSSFRTSLQLRTAHFMFSLHRSFSLPHTHPRTTPHPLIATSEPRGFALRYRIVRISASQLRPWHISGSWYQWMPTIVGCRVFQVVLLGQRGSMVE